jgi:hypothetical protein
MGVPGPSTVLGPRPIGYVVTGAPPSGGAVVGAAVAVGAGGVASALCTVVPPTVRALPLVVVGGGVARATLGDDGETALLDGGSAGEPRGETFPLLPPRFGVGV